MESFDFINFSFFVFRLRYFSTIIYISFYSQSKEKRFNALKNTKFPVSFVASFSQREIGKIEERLL